jgi:hypothetical protein
MSVDFYSFKATHDFGTIELYPESPHQVPFSGKNQALSGLFQQNTATPESSLWIFRG